MAIKMSRNVLVASLLFASPAMLFAQECLDASLYEPVLEEALEAEEQHERLTESMEDAASIKELIGSYGLYMPMNELLSGQLPDEAGEPDQGMLIGDSSEARFEPGARYKALKFSDSDYATVPSSPELDVGAEDFSVFAWVKTTLPGSQTILDKRQSAGVSGYSLNLYSGKVLLQLASPNAWDNYYSNNSPSIADGYWHHIGATVDRDNPSGGKLYVDGQVVHTFNPTRHLGSLSNTKDLLIGHHPFGGTGFNGGIDEIVLVKRVLTGSEVEELMATNGSAVMRQGIYDSELRVDSTTSSHLNLSYRLPDPKTTDFTEFRLCISKYATYAGDPCYDPSSEDHVLTFNTISTYPLVLGPYEPNTVYYLGLVGFKKGSTSYEVLVTETATTKESAYHNDVWHTDVTETSARINWTTSISPVQAVEICWKEAGSLQRACDRAREHSVLSEFSDQSGSILISDLKPGEKYKVKVRVYDANANSTKIGKRRFTTKALPNVNVWAQDVQRNSITMAWSSMAGYDSFEVCWKKAWSLNDTCKEHSVSVYSPDSSYTIWGLDKKKKYKVKVYGHSGGSRIKLYADKVKTSR